MELIPCPFCGGEAELIERRGGWDVSCKRSDEYYCIINHLEPCLDVATKLFPSAEAAVRQWNKRRSSV